MAESQSAAWVPEGASDHAGIEACYYPTRDMARRAKWLFHLGIALLTAAAFLPYLIGPLAVVVLMGVGFAFAMGAIVMLASA